jgi:hypothetical protein
MEDEMLVDESVTGEYRIELLSVRERALLEIVSIQDEEITYLAGKIELEIMHR